MMKKFQKNVEDFTCAHCGFEVKGTGFTNHCSTCLWSKHVDVNPGDRAAACGGMMKPVRFESGKGEYNLTHRCGICKHEKKNKLSPDDNFDEAVKVSSQNLTESQK